MVKVNDDEDSCPKLRGFDGFNAGPNQDLANPLGVNGPELMEWFFHKRDWREMDGEDGGEDGINNDIAAQGFAGIGAWILGQNMFGPIRGPWPDDSWKGWWGEEPPYHTPVFVLTHHQRAPLQMKVVKTCSSGLSITSVSVRLTN